ncbi:hypothetical protein CPLU01_02323 [Colletotrichum plurivorum]|uniref:Uncharacterized protein n=1 Tax=Colletotrichum plurivorum TaxID=2175906 RepID=A0A8H6NN72_9PEZI|nr:hypothetical protein CPLU01_02323 [Colletotrichum plurivorum]
MLELHITSPHLTTLPRASTAARSWKVANRGTFHQRREESLHGETEPMAGRRDGAVGGRTASTGMAGAERVSGLESESKGQQARLPSPTAVRPWRAATVTWDSHPGNVVSLTHRFDWPAVV